MSEDRFYNIVQEIKEIFSFLNEQEPTPDDEIEARDKLINKFGNLKEINEFTELNDLIVSILTNLEGWDTLDLWFKEVKGLAESINKFINVIDTAISSTESILATKDKVVMPSNSEENKLISQLDISNIVSQVSEQFKEEIGSLKDQIDMLKKELEKKDSKIKEPSQPVQASEPSQISEPSQPSQKKKVKKITPKKVSRLAPPKIKIPLIKKPETAPKIKVDIEPKIKELKEDIKIKEEKIDAVDIEEKLRKIKLTEDLFGGPIISQPEKKPSLPLEQPLESDIIIKPVKKPKITPIITEEQRDSLTSEIPFNESQTILSEEDTDFEEEISSPPSNELADLTSGLEKIELTPLPPGKPKIMKPSKESSELTPLPADKPKIMEIVDDEALEKPDEEIELTPLSMSMDKPNKPRITTEVLVEDIEKIPRITTEVFEKSDLTPIISKKPTISPVSIEEIDTESIKSSSTDLFNVFSTMGLNESEQSVAIDEPAEKISEKGKKQKKKKSEKKKKHEKIAEVSVEELKINFPSKQAESMLLQNAQPPSELEQPDVKFDDLPKDRESLYQELIAFEGRRYSLEKSYQNLSKDYESGNFDEYEFTNKSKGLQKNLDEINLHINNIRRIISSL